MHRRRTINQFIEPSMCSYTLIPCKSRRYNQRTKPSDSQRCVSECALSPSVSRDSGFSLQIIMNQQAQLFMLLSIILAAKLYGPVE